MLDIYKKITSSQFEAALCMLEACVERCPPSSWNEPVVNLRFCQAAFHTLIFADLYLGPDVESLRQQPFHRDHQGIFRDYEELEDRPQVLLYEQSFIRDYLQHCRTKAANAISTETLQTLSAPSGFSWLPFSRAELHLSNLRHIQHHAAQMSMRLRIDSQEDIAWVKSGWRVS